ncbi:hypothetical protein FTW19_07295 [Terriglobus albidus]|uniref:Uncharacterized protein n=1 Tax=Terriglobus albidus TaxID=1592106 RepID=A0A5B9EBZ0_9BACT|nr:hypothetical protein [Terriglobus albidus]QEE27817.1 hypothetical protein FTW19_07295 [Terriglobus albidus]
MALNYSVVAQSVDEVRDTGNSPSVSMWEFLQATGQEDLLRTISIYGESGKTREQARTYYMNGEALRVWRAMGKAPTIVGEMHRPAKTAAMVFGVPYSQ